MHDLDVRQSVRRRLREMHEGDPDTLVVEEMGIWSGSVRIDVAVLNGEMHGIELKSAKDTLSRLENQAALYSQVFDRVTLVVAVRHAEKAVKLIPSWWGVWEAVFRPGIGRVELIEVRASMLNPQPDAQQIARLLWRPEALTLLEKFGLLKGFRSKPLPELSKRLATNLPVSILSHEVRMILKGRDVWLRKSAIDL